LLTGLTWVRLFQGDLIRSANDATRLENLARKNGPGLSLGLSIYFRACSDLHKGDFAAAEQRFNSFTQQRYAMPRHGAFHAMAGLALCRQLLQQESTATHTAGNLRTFARELNDSNGLEIAQSCEARIQLLQGDLDRAARWAGFDSKLPVFGELFNSLEVPAITRVRIWIALGTNESLNRAYKHLQKIGKQARQWYFTSHIIEADVLKSLALAGLGREDQALECMADVIDMAAPGGWIRPFLEPGKPLSDLLTHLEGYGLATDFSRQLHSEVQVWRERADDHTRAASDPQPKSEGGLLEALTPRELDVLELLAQRLQNKEISEKLIVSPETVKSHLKRIYQKLDVAKRREAVEKARKLGIIHT
jgi:LuxR family maltose regulon positive regulatory protein